MKKFRIIALLLCVIFIFGGCQMSKNEFLTFDEAVKELSDPDMYYKDTFGQGKIIDVYINIAEKDWQAIVDDPASEIYYPADININGTSVKNVGIRTKGFKEGDILDETDLTGTPECRIRIDEFQKNLTLHGLEDLTLTPASEDVTYMREYLTLCAYTHMGLKTPFTAYANLYINDKPYGFYICQEAIGKSFAKRVSPVNNTCLYKASNGICSLGNDDMLDGFNLVYGKDEDLYHLKSLKEKLNGNIDDIEQILNVDSVLKAVAINTVMGNYQSYNGKRLNNYYLIYTGGKLEYIGDNFSNSLGGLKSDKGYSIKVDINEPVYLVEMSERPLIANLLAVDKYKTKYLEYVDNLIEYFSTFETDVQKVATNIRSAVENDPVGKYTVEEFDNAIVSQGIDLYQAITDDDAADAAEKERKAEIKAAGEIYVKPEKEKRRISIIDYMDQRTEFIKKQK